MVNSQLSFTGIGWERSGYFQVYNGGSCRVRRGTLCQYGEQAEPASPTSGSLEGGGEYPPPCVQGRGRRQGITAKRCCGKASELSLGAVCLGRHGPGLSGVRRSGCLFGAHADESLSVPC